MSKFYRFELLSPDKDFPYQVGLFQGLQEVGLSEQDEWALYGLFDDLPAPTVDDDDDGDELSFWFTEEGLLRFAEALEIVAYEVSCKGWQLVVAVIEDPPWDNAYQDEFQIAFWYDNVQVVIWNWISAAAVIGCSAL